MREKIEKERIKTIKVEVHLPLFLLACSIRLFVHLTQSIFSALRECWFCCMVLVGNSIIQRIVLLLIDWHIVWTSLYTLVFSLIKLRTICRNTKPTFNPRSTTLPPLTRNQIKCIQLFITDHKFTIKLVFYILLFG